MSESNARFAINNLLKDAGWILPGDKTNPNVDTEVPNDAGVADYVLKNSADFPICVIEAKKDLLSPLEGKEQARGYATALNCRFVILSNGVNHYFWDIEQGNPTPIDQFPSLDRLELIKNQFNPNREDSEEICENYIAQTQNPGFQNDPDYLNERTRGEFLQRNKLRLLRDYQLKAVHAIQRGVANGKDRFLLEMATGTGKTLTSCAIIKMFLRLYNVRRVLFLVDRLELEAQAKKEFDEVLKNDYRTVVWKEHQTDWMKAEIVISTTQSFISDNRYRKVFKPEQFGLVISDEAHRSLGARSRKVFEYFIGFKLGLTATPKDFLKAVDIDELGESDPRQLEDRLMRDTYTTFGCESGEPTFRYSLEDGVKDGYLVNPRVIDARTEISTELLSDHGYLFQSVDEDGNDVEATFTKKHFEKKFFSQNTNKSFCVAFLERAKWDPYINEIGKTLIFCVSQKHAANITQILNEVANKVWPNKFNSDFAVQVTSNVDNAQRMTIDFRNNSLNGHSNANPNYRTSKTRVCVTVGMMTTGYDCTDILNICMMRPVYSGSEFIQMKGRGTRKKDFAQDWIDRSEFPDLVNSVKDEFTLFDFFGNYEYFEKDFNYDEVLDLPSMRPEKLDGPDTPIDLDGAINYDPDPLKSINEILILDEGMKVDRDPYRSLKQLVTEDQAIQEMVKRQDFGEAKKYLDDNILDKPEDYVTLDKLSKFWQLDRRLTVREFLLYSFGHINRIKPKRECLEEEFEKFEKEFNPDDEVYSDAIVCFEAYLTDSEFRDIIDSKKLAKLNMHTSGNAFRSLSPKLRREIPKFIRKNVDWEIFEDAG